MSLILESKGFVATKLRYYIHDRVESCRLELLGSLNAEDVPELEGCWRTVKTTVGNRTVILDLRHLESSDDAGRRWVMAMRAEGAKIMETGEDIQPASKQRSGASGLFSAASHSTQPQ
ncbi:MAG: hypothetical protein JO061_08365 [Acidobacteriaceae bacterium]|nr:hypothetical protein [Acidobacteriaceae bacterium]